MSWFFFQICIGDSNRKCRQGWWWTVARLLDFVFIADFNRDGVSISLGVVTVSKYFLLKEGYNIFSEILIVYINIVGYQFGTRWSWCWWHGWCYHSSGGRLSYMKGMWESKWRNMGFWEIIIIITAVLQMERARRNLFSSSSPRKYVNRIWYLHKQ